MKYLDSFLDPLLFLVLTLRGLNSLGPEKKLNLLEPFSLFCSILLGQVVPVIRSKVQRAFDLFMFCTQILQYNCSSPQLLLRYHCGSLNIGIHQLRGSHWESPIYPCIALCTEEGLTLRHLPKSGKCSFSSNSLWWNLLSFI